MLVVAFAMYRARGNEGTEGVIGSVLGVAAARRLSAWKGSLHAIFATLILIAANYMLYRNWMVLWS